MWNLKNKINKQNGNRVVDTENRLRLARGEQFWGATVKGHWLEKYRVVGTEYSRLSQEMVEKKVCCPS